MEPRELLEAQVAVVATLGELVVTVTPPCRTERLFMYPASLHDDLRRFTWTLRDTLRHPDFTYLVYRDVTSVYQRDVTELGRALAALRDSRWGTWVHVRAAARAWREPVDELVKSWIRVTKEALELRDTWEDTATNEGTNEDTDEDTDAATTIARAGDLQDDATGWGTAGDNLVAAAQQRLVSLPSVVAAHEAPMAAATKAIEEAMVATSQAGTATSQAGTATRRLRVEKVQGLLEHLVVACDRATMLPRELWCQLQEIEAILKGTNEASRHVPEALVAAVAEAERLWEASARLSKRHLLVTLGDIQHFLFSPYGVSSDLGYIAVSEQRQKAIEDIPRLLEGSDVTGVTSSGQ